MDGDGIILAFALLLAVAGAILFVFGIMPTFNGNSANMPLTVFGVALMIIGIAIGAVMGVLGRD